jgi:hypothetical protein
MTRALSTFSRRGFPPFIAWLSVLCLPATQAPAQPAPDARYQTRTSDCRHSPPTGTPLSVRRTDSGVITRGYTAERLLTFIADARGLEGGDILVCSEYGRVEIADSDDDQVRLQVRMEGFGEGSEQPAEAARRVIAETDLHVFLTNANGRLMVRVWHPTLGFTAPGGQPTWVNVRLHVPNRGAYQVTSEAFHGNVIIRRLTLAGARLRGNVGEKFKGIPGFIGHTELDNVVLAGDVDIDNFAGIPGVRPAVPAPLRRHAAPILVKASRVTSSSRITATTGGDISIAVQPSPELAVRASGLANDGGVSIMIYGATEIAAPGDSAFKVQRSFTSNDLESRNVRVVIRAASTHGAVRIASMPAAPLAPRAGGS